MMPPANPTLTLAPAPRRATPARRARRADPLTPLAAAISEQAVSTMQISQDPKTGNYVVALVAADKRSGPRSRAKVKKAESPAAARKLVMAAIGDAVKQVMRANVAALALLIDSLAPAQAAPRDEASARSRALTTEEVAGQLGVSRPYVAMLCDAGLLGAVTVTEGGHRRISPEAVNAYQAKRAQETAGAQSPRVAAYAIGMYDRDEAEYVRVLKSARREQSAATPRRAAKKATPRSTPR